MDPKDKEKTTFDTNSGHYQWKCMPMGVVNSEAVWQRTADIVLTSLLGKLCHVCLDNFIVYSGTFEQPVKDLERVLLCLKEAELKSKPSKCQFLKPMVMYLGHIISREGIRLNAEKVECVVNFRNRVK